MRKFTTLCALAALATAGIATGAMAQNDNGTTRADPSSPGATDTRSTVRPAGTSSRRTREANAPSGQAPNDNGTTRANPSSPDSKITTEAGPGGVQTDASPSGLPPPGPIKERVGGTDARDSK